MNKPVAVRAPLIATLIALSGVVACTGVDFDNAIDGNAYERGGSLFGRSASIVVDFGDPDVVILTAEAKNGDTITDAADGTCDRGAPEQGLFETRLPTDNCVFEFTVTSTEEPPEPPTALVVGFMSAADDGSVEIDPSLDGPLPSPFSAVDDYAVYDLVE